MKRVILFTIISLTIFGNLYSQEEVNLKEIFDEAEYYILYDDYQEALPLYLQLVKNDYVNAYINHRIGECYLQIPGQKQKSISYLEEACKNISDHFREGSFKEIHAPARALFYLGNAYQVNTQLDKAIETYQKFKESLKVEDIYNIDYVNQQIESCNNAKELINMPIQAKRINMGGVINDGFSNVYPVLSSDEKSIVYISKLKFYDAILYSQKTEEGWSAPININADIQSDGDYYPRYLSADGKTLVLYRYENFSGDIYISKLVDNKWQLPEKQNKNINSKFLESHASLAEDENTIYFVSDRKDGFGGLDIYKSTFDENINDWGEPVNLGSEINTAFDEESPILSEDGSTLFFSSQGHYNMGGFDIFYAKKTGVDEWSTPVNIGYPINTTDDNLYFYPIQNGTYAFISAYDSNNFGQEDIYKIECYSPEHPFFVNVRGKVSLQDKQKNFSKNNFHIEVLDSTKTNAIETIYLDENGQFSIKLAMGSYQFVFKSKEYEQKTKIIAIPKNYCREELVFNVELVPSEVSTGEYVSIKSIYFGFDDFSLSKESKIELERVYILMMEHPSLNIEVVGHTDAIGSFEYNKKLSIKRAESAIEYLIIKGIDKTRFLAKGVGKEQPIALNINKDGSDNPEGRKFNRRIEIKVLDSDDNIIISEDHNIPKNLKYIKK